MESDFNTLSCRGLHGRPKAQATSPAHMRGVIAAKRSRYRELCPNEPTNAINTAIVRTCGIGSADEPHSSKISHKDARVREPSAQNKTSNQRGGDRGVGRWIAVECSERSGGRYYCAPARATKARMLIVSDVAWLPLAADTDATKPSCGAEWVGEAAAVELLSVARGEIPAPALL